MNCQLSKSDVIELFAREMGVSSDRVSCRVDMAVYKGVDRRDNGADKPLNVTAQPDERFFLLSVCRHSYIPLHLFDGGVIIQNSSFGVNGDAPADGCLFERFVFGTNANVNGTPYGGQIIFYRLTLA